MVLAWGSHAVTVTQLKLEQWESRGWPDLYFRGSQGVSVWLFCMGPVRFPPSMGGFRACELCTLQLGAPSMSLEQARSMNYLL